MKRWYFTEHDRHPPVWWTWRVHGSRGGIEQVSDGFKTYAAALADAIRKGFNPAVHYRVVETSQAVVHFARGRRVSSSPGKRLRRGIANLKTLSPKLRSSSARAARRRASAPGTNQRTSY